MSKKSPVISHSHEEFMNLEDALDLNVSESKTPDTSKPEVENNLESFAENLGLKFAKKEDLRKFYDFVGPDFTWPSKNENDHLEVFEFIVDPEWEDVSTEIATNALAYHRLVESGAFKDKPKGSYVLIVHGEVLKYYEKDVSSEDYEQLEKKYPGKYFAPITRETVLLRRFSAIASTTRNEWQVHICIRDTLNFHNEARMAGTDNGWRFVMDTGAETTIIPFFLRQRLQSSREGWRSEHKIANGYGGGIRMFQASRPWLVCLGDGTNWSNWIRTQSIYSWPKDTSGIDCGLVGYEILDNIPHFKSVGNPYIFLRDNSVFNRLQGAV